MSSKYDSVKVKVHLGGDHYYVLSRFLLSKMLTFCKLPTTEAVRVSLALKKFFVDQNRLDIVQKELEAAIFSIMAQRGYGEAYARLFPVMTRFYMERVPLVVFIAGSGCCGKTTTAHSLSVKLNTHNVVSTDMLLEILAVAHDIFPPAGTTKKGNEGQSHSSGTWLPPDNRGLWLRQMDTETDFVRLWHSWAEAVRPLVEGEVTKALADGKVLLVEGSLLDISLYRPYLVREFQRGCGAIVVAFYISTDDPARHFTVERLVSRCHSMLPAPYINDNATATEWVMNRLKTIEAEQLKSLTGENSGVKLHRIDAGLSAGVMTDIPCILETQTTPVIDGNGGCSSSPTVSFLGADEGGVPVHLVTYSLENPSASNELMHELVLERIMTELHHRQVFQ